MKGGILAEADAGEITGGIVINAVIGLRKLRCRSSLAKMEWNSANE